MVNLQQMKTLCKAFLCVSVVLLAQYCVILHKDNKKLTESLEMAQNNIESYQNIINGATTENNTLKLTVKQLKQANDSLLVNMTNKAEEHNIKLKDVNTAATQTQKLHVSNSKGVKGDIIDTVSSTIYSDTLVYNDLTNLYITIDKDTITATLDIHNVQYLYTYKRKEYKNKKNFFKRLFTLDFKKVTKYDYKIFNTNELIETDDVRIVEITE